MMDYKKLIDRAEPFMQGLGKAILREIAVSFEALQSKLGDAIQSSAHWQHQCTDLQTENERLKTDRNLEKKLRKDSDERAHNAEAERDALQAKLDELTKQEPVAWVLEWIFDGEVKGQRLYDDERHCLLDAEKDGGICRPLVYGDIHAAPKALEPPPEWAAIKNILDEYGLQAIDFVADFKNAAFKAQEPLTDEQIRKLYCHSALKDRIVVRSDWEQGVRDAEAAHGITKGTP